MAATLSKGTVIRVESAPGSGVYTTYPGQSNVSGPQLTSTEHNVSSHDTTGLVMEFLAGMIDPGSLTFTIFDDVTLALHRQLYDDKIALTVRNHRKLWLSGYWIGMSAYVKDHNPSHGVDAPHNTNIQLRLIGAPTMINSP